MMARFRGFGRRGQGSRGLRAALWAAAAVSGLVGSEAMAQERAFKLDRLEMPGSPEDGVTLFRPVTQKRTMIFGQLGVGYTRSSFTTNLVVPDRYTRVLNDSSRALVENQLTIYGNAGVHLFDRFTFGVAFPWSPWQSGQTPRYNTSYPLGTVTPDTGGPSAGDVRLDARAILARSQNRNSALGFGAHVFLPTGSSNFGGDGSTGLMLGLSGETKVWHLSLVANAGFHFRPSNKLGSPAQDSGIGVSNELRYGVGAFLPLPVRTGRFRIGASLFGTAGMANNDRVGDTIFRKENMPLEANAEGRMRFGPADRMWVGVSGGTRVLNGYGSPDFRVLGFWGIEAPLFESDAKSPDPKLALREKWRREALLDSDGDGIPDEYDACPFEKEDGIGDPNDGCPTNDRDGDGIPDNIDKCPDEPEDKDGFEDEDGCPDYDNDKDGIPDAEDACPREPGQPSPDPTKNGCPGFVVRDGSSLRILQQVNFATGSSTILPSSFPLLKEIAAILQANPGIRRMSIEGHTDNKGGAAMNKKLSQGRADSVMKWLTSNGIAADRLEAHGYGLEKPIADNATADGRAKNRRVEFKILQEDGQ